MGWAAVMSKSPPMFNILVLLCCEGPKQREKLATATQPNDSEKEKEKIRLRRRRPGGEVRVGPLLPERFCFALLRI